MSATAPSPFAVLLRRSKFASYDPLIGQVYTTYGGHAHRGNWGLKRPLPNRRRVGFITVRSVDSPEQQTEWNSAESSARWLRRWEELGKNLDLDELANWPYNPHSWPIDTEFDRAGQIGREPGREIRRGAGVSESSNLVPDPRAMSPKQFKKYLDRLRALRPEFKKFLKDAWHTQQAERAQQNQHPYRASKMLKSEQTTRGILTLTGSGDIDMFASAQNAGNLYVDKFLERRSLDALNSLESRRVEARPHTSAGLQYSFLSTFQSQYLHKPAPGRNVSQSRSTPYEGSQRQDKSYVIAVGGILGNLKLDDGTQTIIPTDFGTQEGPRQHREQGKALFQMNKVKLLRVPSTVGREPEKANATKFRSVEFRTSQLAKANSSNPYPLGSLDYVGWEDVNQSKGGAALIPAKIYKRAEDAEMFRTQASGKANIPIIDTLSAMVAEVRSVKRHRKKE